jgi:hypothetical protein
LTKNELGYLLGDFSQTHLVTLGEKEKHFSAQKTISIYQPEKGGLSGTSDLRWDRFNETMFCYLFVLLIRQALRA